MSPDWPPNSNASPSTPTYRPRRIGGATAIALGSVGAVLLIGLVVGLAASRGGEPEPSETTSLSESEKGAQWYDVRRRSFDVTITASGELETKEKVEVRNKVERRTSIIEIIDEGTAVEKGDVLAKLADDEILKDIEQETLRVEEARAADVAAREELAVRENEAKSKQQSAEVKLEMAKLDLAKWQQGTDPKAQRDFKLALEKAQRRVERAKRDVELSEQLYDQKFISLNELEDDRIELIEAEAALVSAQQDITVYDDFTQPKERREATTNVEQAEAELERTVLTNNSDIARLNADVQSKKRSLKMREEALDKLNEQLQYTTITAPTAGLAVYGTSVGHHWERGDPLRPGRDVYRNQLMFVLPDTRQMVASLRVHESAMPEVKLGQKVTVTIDARPGQTVEGSVTQIAVMAETGNWMNPELREYTVRVDLPAGFDLSLKPAMKCAGEIVLDHVDDAIAVPIQAVVVEGEERFCYVQDGSGVRRQPVTIGKASEKYVELLDGVTEGERVLLRRPKPSEVTND